MGRYYLALIDLPLKDNLIIEAPIARNPKDRLKMAVVKGGKSAKSAFLKIACGCNNRCELISAKLYSGRTHQIRVHLNSINRHILGDSTYGFKQKNDKIKRVFLHAYILYLIHPTTKQQMQFVAQIPQDIKEYLVQNFKGEVNDKILPDSIIKSFSSSNSWLCRRA
jgi:23S rRNA pseudouridine1911/1915/1917 synthase